VPNQRRKPPQTPARNVLNEIFGSVFDFVGERVSEAAPRCELCGEIAIPLRCACGRFACKSHGYFNFSLGRVICPTCALGVGAQVEAPGDEDDGEENAAPPRPRAKPRPRAHPPRQEASAVSTAWEMLGLDPATATEADVNKSFRQAARGCHPDLFPRDVEAARQFKGLRRATDLCLADLASR
jgi:hypothetical protein